MAATARATEGGRKENGETVVAPIVAPVVTTTDGTGTEVLGPAADGKMAKTATAAATGGWRKGVAEENNDDRFFEETTAGIEEKNDEDSGQGKVVLLCRTVSCGTLLTVTSPFRYIGHFALRPAKAAGA